MNYNREPSIHISLTKLTEILEDLNLKKPEKLAVMILKKGVNYSLSNRVVHITNDKVKRDMTRIIKASDGDTKLLNKLIYLIRTNKLKHKGISMIKSSNLSQWSMLKNLTNVCIDFCNNFNLKKKEGFTIYLEIGLAKISSSRNLVNKLVDMQESINKIYEAKEIIDNDERSKVTMEIHEYYIKKIESQTGIYNSFISDPIIYKCFVGVRHIIDKYKVPYKIYIDAQFVGLSFTESIATPYQLITEKAIERLNSYLYKNKLKIDNGEDTIKLSKVDILKKIKDGNN